MSAEIKSLGGLVICLSIFVSPRAGVALGISCEATESASLFSITSNAPRKIQIPGRSDACASGFEFLPESPGSASGLLILSPSELDLRSTNTIYRVSFRTGDVLKLGNISASAERKGGGYVDIFQEGGSIYMMEYVIGSSAVELSANSLELVIDGAVCLLPATSVRSTAGLVDPDCRKTTHGSFSNPICIAHEGKSSRQVNRAICKELEPNRLHQDPVR